MIKSEQAERDNPLANQTLCHSALGLSVIRPCTSRLSWHSSNSSRPLRRTDLSIPFLFITAVDPALINEPGLQAEILAKPSTPDAFLEVVGRLISKVDGPGHIA